MANDNRDRSRAALATLLAVHGGILIVVGMLGGLGYGAVVVADTDPQAIANWRVVHIQNLQNGMLLLLVAACSGFTSLSAVAFRTLTWLLIAAAYCDMVAWFIRTATGESGRLPAPPPINQLVFLLFGLTLAGQFAGVCIFIAGAWRHFRRGETAG